jgi:hypothetical protein
MIKLHKASYITAVRSLQVAGNNTIQNEPLFGFTKIHIDRKVLGAFICYVYHQRVLNRPQKAVRFRLKPSTIYKDKNIVKAIEVDTC